MTKQESINAYNKYITNHINAVKEGFYKYGKELCRILNIDIQRLKWMVDDHDHSKYSKEEFEAYRKKFYKSEDDLESDSEIEYLFDIAWQHHLSLNSHHPEFWVNTKETHSIHVMDKYSVAEMLLDWYAMGIINGEKRPVVDYWFQGEGNKKPLRPEVVRWINNCIDIFK